MYEKNLKGKEVVRQLRSRQGKRNESERRAMLEPLTDSAAWVNEIPVDITVRYEHEGWQTFQAKKLRGSTHFPYIVPELVDESGDYLLITYLTFGSLLRLHNMVIER